MSFVFESSYLWPLLIAALISSLVAVYAWTKRANSSAIALALLSLAIAEWTLGYALEIAGADLSTKLLWGKLQYLGIASLPVFWLIFAFNHANQGNRLTHWRMFLLSILPIITILLVFTTEIHGLIWKEFSIGAYQNFSALEITHGPWFWVHTAYSYSLLAIGIYIVLRSIGRMEGLYRGQTAALIIAVLTPVIGSVLYLSGLSPIPDLDITPFAFLISVAGLAWGIFGFRLVDISPIAREMVVEAMREGMIVLDKRGRIADINPAAARMIGVPAALAIGKSAVEVLSPWPHLIERFRGVAESSDIIVIGKGESERHYSVRISSLQDQQMQPVGRVISVQDLDEESSLPEPRFATPSAPQADATLVEVPKAESPNSLWGWLVDLFTTPPQLDLPTPPGLNPSWFQARERAFTIILRIAALIGTIALLIAPSKLAAGIPFAIIIGLIWFLGLARQFDFKTRTYVFLFLVYILASVEMYNYGYSAASFTFFMTLVVSAALLTERKEWIITLTLSVITIGVFGVLIGQGIYLPINANEGIPVPNNLQRALTNTLVFAACGLALLTSVTILIESLNQAWRKESQALNLLQQERDLLEQRVIERTGDLAKARDKAVQTSNDLRKYFLAMEQSGNTIIITDTKGTIEYANPKFEALTGYSRAEVLGSNSRILNSGEHDQAYYKNLWETISSGKIWYGEFHNRRKDGSLFWEAATIAPLVNADGIIANYVAIKEDITAQKELQDQLREQNETLMREVAARQRTTLLLLESETRFRQIVENASDIIYRTDVQGRFNYVNPTALRLMNFANETEVIGKHYLDLAILSARHKLKRFYDHQFLSRTQSTYYEFPAITHDGREIWLGQSVQLITEGEEIIGFQAVARDITVIKQAQEALSISRDQALEASGLKSQLLSRVSHELRTPLGAILGYAELLTMNTFGELNEEQKDASLQIMESADYLSKMVNDLLDQAQAESKKISLHRAIFSPASMLQKVQTSMDILAQNKGLEFSTSLAPELPELLYGDEHRLQQILLNLTGNAIKFTRTGKVQIKAYQSAPAQWALQVCDTGAGIPKEAQAYIFEPFRQVDNSITRENRGTGLGLSITKQLVELMDGEIRLESEVGHGSTFTVTLPILRKPEQAA